MTTGHDADKTDEETDDLDHTVALPSDELIRAVAACPFCGGEVHTDAQAREDIFCMDCGAGYDTETARWISLESAVDESDL